MVLHELIYALVLFYHWIHHALLKAIGDILYGFI